MRVTSAILALAALAQPACSGCRATHLDGDGDAEINPDVDPTDTIDVTDAADPDSHLEPAPDPVLDTDVEPEPACQDLDEDGHEDVACGGDDCDDSDSLVHPGAEETCDDGVDSNCSGDGRDLVMLMDPVEVSSDESATGTLLWTGSEFGIVWYDGRPTDAGWGQYFERIGMDGSELGEDTHLLDESSDQDLIWIGDTYVVTWLNTDDSELVVVQMDADGTISRGRLEIPYEFLVFDAPQMVWTGSEVGILWGAGEFFQIHRFFTRIGFCGSM